MCIGSWNLLSLIDDSNIIEALGLDVVNGKKDELLIGWDSISAK